MILVSQKQNVLFTIFQLISQEEFLYEFLYIAYTIRIMDATYHGKLLLDTCDSS